MKLTVLAHACPFLPPCVVEGAIVSARTPSRETVGSVSSFFESVLILWEGRGRESSLDRGRSETGVVVLSLPLQSQTTVQILAPLNLCGSWLVASFL